MADLVVHSDAESALIAWLPGQLAARGLTVDVGDTLLGDDTMAVYRTGGVEAWLLMDAPSISFDTKAATPRRAVEILNMTRALISDLVRSGEAIPAVDDDGDPTGDLVWIVGYEEFAGPANLPREGDPGRYTMLLSLTVGARIL